MGTANYHYVNASRVFAVETEEEESSRQILMFAKRHDECFKQNFYFRDRYELRSYPSSIIGTKWCEVHLDKFGLRFFANVYITMVLRAGYHEGSCLDWTVHIDDGTYDPTDFELMKYIADQLEESVLKSTTVEYLLDVANEIREEINKLIKETEELFAKISTQYEVMATFSKGEAIYNEIQNV